MTDHPIISRADAKARGLKRYFTGSPCRQGHLSPRHVSSTNCLTCNKETVGRIDRASRRPKPPTMAEIHGDECRRLRDEGLSILAIAAKIGISDSTVRYALADEETRGRIRTLKRNQKGTGFGRVHDPAPKHRPTRVPVQQVSKEVKDDAIRAFAEYRISRDELMRRITPSRLRVELSHAS